MRSLWAAVMAAGQVPVQVPPYCAVTALAICSAGPPSAWAQREARAGITIAVPRISQNTAKTVT